MKLKSQKGVVAYELDGAGIVGSPGGLSSLANPVRVAVQIGNDAGEADVVARIRE